ncbi:MAG: AAA family ATPase [Candidatus Atribacteria bacterium]|nr:AAA family ATPase [Candidatus Atribacteria bacterium]
MRIIRLQAENIKKIKAIDITPTTDMVVISGKNGAGKSSALDAIWFALEGRGSLKKTPEPIRKGEKNAKVTLTLDDFIVTKNFTANDKSYLKVTNKEGLAYGSPQELLDSFIGQLAFDPLEFAQMKEGEQRNLLLQVAEIDIDSLDDKIMDLREERRLKGQEVKLLSGQREEITTNELPEKVISTSVLNDELEVALNNISDWNNTFKDLGEHKRRFFTLKEELIKLENIIVDEEKWIKENHPVDVSGIKERILKADNINYQVMARERNKIADKKQKEAQDIYDNYTSKIDDVIKQKETALSTAKMPITGLGISETGVTYNDIPFGQLSSSEQLRVSLAIAMALNPKLKVIRITDGSLLDEDSMEIIRKLAEKKDYQVWVEKVDGTGKIGFYIEEGEVVNEN